MNLPVLKGSIAKTILLFGIGLLVWSTALPAKAVNIAKLEKSVVRIVNQERDGTSTGTGFVLNDQGYIGTNWHVIHSDRGSELSVLERTPGGPNKFELLPAKLIWSNAELDLAIIKIAPNRHPAVPLATAPPAKGAPVWALGFPGAADRIDLALETTVTNGVLSRIFTGAWRSRQLVIFQHTAAVNPGNSGGPLFDDCGRVVAVNTQAELVASSSGDRIPSASGIFWSSHITELMRVLDAKGIKYTKRTSSCTQSSGGSSGGGAGQDEAARDAARQAQEDAEQARREAEKLNETLEDLQFQRERDLQQFSETIKGITSDRRKLEIALVVVGLIAALGLVFGLRKPREVIKREVVRASRVLSRRVDNSSAAVQHRPAGGYAAGGARSTSAQLQGMGGAPSLTLQFGVQRSASDGVVIGRHAALSDYQLSATTVSRRHCRIGMAGTGYWIEDLTSTSGTKVNGVMLQPYQRMTLSNGAVIEIADQSFKFMAG